MILRITLRNVPKVMRCGTDAIFAFSFFRLMLAALHENSWTFFGGSRAARECHFTILHVDHSRVGHDLVGKSRSLQSDRAIFAPDHRAGFLSGTTAHARSALAYRYRFFSDGRTFINHAISQRCLASAHGSWARISSQRPARMNAPRPKGRGIRLPLPLGRGLGEGDAQFLSVPPQKTCHCAGLPATMGS